MQGFKMANQTQAFYLKWIMLLSKNLDFYCHFETDQKSNKAIFRENTACVTFM